MLKTSLTAVIAAGLLSTAHATQNSDPAILPEHSPAFTPQEETLRTALRAGLSGGVSETALRALTTGERIPIIVLLEDDKTEAGAERAQDMESRINAVARLQERVLLDAFGVQGVLRADLGNVIARRGGDGDLSTVTRTYQATPGFSMIATANDIAVLNATQGVSAIFEDRAEPPLLQDTTVLVGAETVWANGFEGTGYSIAVLDSGVEAEHPMTGPAITASACFNQVVPGVSTSNCPGGVAQVTSLTSSAPGDSCVEAVLDPANGTNGCFHGTHVASTAAGRSTPLTSGPIAGVARDADIIAVNVFARFPAAQCGVGATQPCILSWTSDQIAALDWLFVNRGSLDLAAVNMSLGGGSNTSSCDATDPRTSVINNLRSAGIATVIASGNNGFTNAVSTPSCISSAITVGSTTKTDAVSGFSNASAQIDLLAPGSGILAAWQSEEPDPGQNCIAAGTPRAPGPDGFCHWYSTSSGTSMATPHVAGAFALLREAFPTATVTDIELALESTGVPVLDTRNGLTFPRIQIDAAYAQLSGTGPINNNDFADRIVLSGASVVTSGDNLGADKEPGEPNHASAGGASVWWSWTAPSSGPVTIDTFGSGYDTLLGVYTGNAVNALTTVATNDDAGGGLQSRVQFTASAGQTYQIAVDGWSGAQGVITLRIQ